MEKILVKAVPSLNPKELKQLMERFEELGIRVEEDLKFLLPTHISFLKPIQATRLLHYAKNVDKDTIDLNVSRIQTNIDLAKDMERRIKAADDDIKKLKEALYYDYVDFEPVFFNEPRLVCTSTSCVTLRSLSDRIHCEYNTVCQDPCYLQNCESERTNMGAVRNCAVMNGTNHCVKCKCSYEKHMLIYHKNVLKTVKKIDSNIEREITDKEQTKKQLMMTLKECKERQAKLMKEQNSSILFVQNLHLEAMIVNTGERAGKNATINYKTGNTNSCYTNVSSNNQNIGERSGKGHRNIRLRASNNTINNERNILILGETGVGKSTFIKSFANYFKYSSLDEAEKQDLICLIPTAFTMTDQDYKERHIKFGTDLNESEKPGSSQTQGCRNYEFEVGDITVRLIDTPGIGDTRGIDQDTENLKKIISHISNFSVLNGILILLKPNNARLSVLFRFCIQELLAHLHKSASHNIIFLFTNARGTFYRPGDTLPSLRVMLEKTAKTPPHVEIKLNHNTIYCLDNEAFRFLVALKSKVSFDYEERKYFAAVSWNISAKECQRLMEYIIGLSPHTIDDTISLYEAKQIVLLLARPLCNISFEIQNNIDLAKNQERRIKEVRDDIEKLNEALYYDYVDFEPVPVDAPRTVCTSEGCVTVRTLSDRTVSDYTRVCHDPCYLRTVEKDTTINEALRKCEVMNGAGHCVKCRCNYEKHMRIYYKLVEKIVKVKNLCIEKEITEKEQLTKQLMQTLKGFQERQAKLMKEQDTITNASAQIAHFLWANAIILHNDATMDYLEHLLEKQESALDSSNQKRVDHLKRIKQEYEQQCKTIEQSLETTKDPKLIFTPQMIRDLKKKIFSLELNGSYIRQAVEGLLTED